MTREDRTTDLRFDFEPHAAFHQDSHESLATEVPELGKHMPHQPYSFAKEYAPDFLFFAQKKKNFIQMWHTLYFG